MADSMKSIAAAELRSEDKILATPDRCDNSQFNELAPPADLISSSSVPAPAPAPLEETNKKEKTEDDMASTSARPERAYHQDYIARVRYDNALPPPHGPPKLLDIPIDGMAHFTSPAFASRIAKSQPLNIEPDAELGMPIDLVGMPGIFDGDESSIQAPLVPPPVHPRDKALLRPLSELGKPKYAPGGHSFLRRTEYISSETGRARPDPSAFKNPVKPPVKPRKPADTTKDEPINVLRASVKGFDIANPKEVYGGPDNKDNIRGTPAAPAEVESWNNPKHPAKSGTKVLDAYPIVPDVDAITDSGSFMVTKFASNPTQSTTVRDTRMDVALLHPIEMKPEVAAEFKAKQAAHEADPAHNPAAGDPQFSYDLFLPLSEHSVKNIKKKFDVDDPEKDNDALYTKKDKSGVGSFRYEHVRTYDTARQSGTPDHPYKEVALALHDLELEKKSEDTDIGERSQEAADGRLDKAAYYYPIAQKLQLKPRRNQNLAQLGLASRTADGEDDKLDAVDLVITEPDEVEEARRAEHHAGLGLGP